MSTRSRAIILGPNGNGEQRVYNLYRHTDGYPTGSMNDLVDSLGQMPANGHAEDLIHLASAAGPYQVEELHQPPLTLAHFGNQSDLEWIYVVDLNHRAINVYGPQNGLHSGCPAELMAPGPIDPVRYVDQLLPAYQDAEREQILAIEAKCAALGYQINTQDYGLTAACQREAAIAADYHALCHELASDQRFGYTFADRNTYGYPHGDTETVFAGYIEKITDYHVIQRAPNGAALMHDRGGIGDPLAVGDLVTITYNAANQPTVADFAPSPAETKDLKGIYLQTQHKAWRPQANREYKGVVTQIDTDFIVHKTFNGTYIHDRDNLPHHGDKIDANQIYKVAYDAQLKATTRKIPDRQYDFTR